MFQYSICRFWTFLLLDFQLLAISKSAISHSAINAFDISCSAISVFVTSEQTSSQKQISRVEYERLTEQQEDSIQGTVEAAKVPHKVENVVCVSLCGDLVWV